MYGRKEAGFRKEDIGAEVLRKKEEGGGREGPRTAEEEDRVCGGGPAGLVTNGDVRALSAQPCRVGDHLHKYCLQKAINGSFTCSELAICTFFFRNNFFASVHKFDALQLAFDRRAWQFFMFGSSLYFLGYKHFLLKKEVPNKGRKFSKHVLPALVSLPSPAPPPSHPPNPQMFCNWRLFPCSVCGRSLFTIESGDICSVGGRQSRPWVWDNLDIKQALPRAWTGPSVP